MAAWNGLFLLIRSLSAPEKRNFLKLLRSGHAERAPKHARVFELILAAESWDEKALKTQLADEGYETRFFSADKRYLYLSLLSFLRETPSLRSEVHEIRAMLTEAEVLYDRGLHINAVKRLKQARRLAMESESWPQLLEAVQLQYRITEELEGPAVALRFTGTLRGLRRVLREIQVTEQLHSRMLAILRSNPRLRDPDSRARAARILAHPLMQLDQPLRAAQARVSRHRVHAAWSFMNSQAGAELHHAAAALRILRVETSLQQSVPELTARQFARVMAICKYAPEPRFRQLMAAFQAFPGELRVPNQRIEAFVTGQAYPIAISRYVALNRFQEAFELLPRLEKDLPRYRHLFQKSALMGIYYGMACLELARHALRPALKYVNHILNEFRVQDRPELYHFAQLFSLMLHYDLGNIPLLEYRVRAVRMAFRKRKSLFRTEKALLRFFEAVTRARNAAEYPDLLDGLRAEMEKALEQPFEQNAHILFDYFRWVDARRSGLPFLETPVGRAWLHYREQLPEEGEQSLMALRLRPGDEDLPSV